MKKIQNFVRRIGKDRIILLLFIPFGAFFFYHDGWIGLISAMFGWWLGGVLYENNDRIKKYPWKKFFRRHLKMIVKLVILVPVVAACCYYAGWRGFVGSILGIIVGEIICWRFLK